MEFPSLWVLLAVWLLDAGLSRIGSEPLPTIEPGNGWNQRKTIMTSPEKHWLRQGEESSSSKRFSLGSLLSLRDPQRVVFIYVIGIALLIMGGLYSIWRMSVLSAFQSQAWEYMKERDARWEKHAADQTELSREILRRLPAR
jgi:hypothetical protein